MELLKRKPENIIRVEISRKNDKRYYLNFSDSTVDQVSDFIWQEISKIKINPFSKGYRTIIMVRNSISGKNKSSKSISLLGLSTKETWVLIVTAMGEDPNTYTIKAN
jgi:hypothetical protein